MYQFLLLFLTIFSFVSISLANDIYDPQPCDGDLVLPMPNGAKMVFRSVFLGIGKEPWAYKEITLGDKDETNYREYPTPTRFSGSFIKKNPNSNEEDWMFYLGKYEVTKDQYYSIMDKDKMNGSQMPITNISWFDAQNFIREYNLWLFENASDELPENNGTPGFLRLPTETEWEFAARGGSEVSDEKFYERHPYPKDMLKISEWHFERANNNVKKVGTCKVEHPLKIHDILGNVSEMTNSFYSVEYFLGRLGGFVARGGSVSYNPEDLRSSFRQAEMPFYKKKEDKELTKELTQGDLGFRLVISSHIFEVEDATRGKLNDALKDYITQRLPPLSLAFSGQPLGSQTHPDLNKIIEIIKPLKEELKNTANSSQQAKGWLKRVNELDLSLVNIQKIVRKWQVDSAYAWITNTTDSALLFCMHDIAPRNIIENDKRKFRELYDTTNNKILKEQYGKNLRKVEENLIIFEDNIKHGLSRYQNALDQLEKIDKEIVDDAFRTYITKLESRNDAINELEAAKLLQKHYQDKISDSFILRRQFEEFAVRFK